MSITAIRAALETKLGTISPVLSTAYENVAFTPVAGVPYQECYTLRATPENSTLGDGFYKELGIFQVSLKYPQGVGPSTAEARAILIRAAFKRGTVLTSGTTKVLVTATPEIGAGRVDGDRWAVIVKVRWSAGIIA
jgi:hypothetical protein